jgi:vancomycin aglycone glucosyltransferase
MLVLLSTIGSRGDVQPLIALALALGAEGHETRLCAPPDFRELAEGYGIPFTGVGPPVRHVESAWPAGEKPSAEAVRQLMRDTISGQFAVLGEAAAGVDVIIASTALQYAAHSIAEHRDIPYFFAAYSPIVLPSPRHAPPPLPGRPKPEAAADYSGLWEEQAQRWNELFGPAVNERRTALGLGPVSDVRSYMFTARPLLAADPSLAPWPEPSKLRVTQTGAWMLRDQRSLPAELESFLAAGDPPVYFGFGSTRTAPETGRTVIEAARALGRPAIVSSGWADLKIVDGPDCLRISEVNLQQLFRRVAAVVHHGGAGTTTAAAAAGAPQVIVPHRYDQHYFAERIDRLGVGAAHAAATMTVNSLAAALERALQASVAAAAGALAEAVKTDGANVAARLVTGGRGTGPEW